MLAASPSQAFGSSTANRSLWKSVATAPGDLRISCLDAKRTEPRGNIESRAVFAYWFVGKGRVTPYHWLRILLTTKDRVLFNRNARWAYFLIYAPMTTERGASQQR